jgi:FkbM family methyltransferase
MIKIMRLIPSRLFEYIYRLKIVRFVNSVADYLTKNQGLKPYNLFNGVVMEIDASKKGERGIIFNLYEPEVTQKVLDIAKEGGIVFDIGAWTGYYTVLAAKTAEKVVAVEIDEKNCQRIKTNVDLNGFSNVTILNIAAGDKSSEIMLLEGQASYSHKASSQVMLLEGKASCAHRAAHEMNIRTVQMEPLDNIILSEMKISKVNLVIMDIEGYEYFALMGMQRSLSAGIIKNLICEIHPAMLKENGITEDDVMSFLSNCGYNITYVDKTIHYEPYRIHAVFTRTSTRQINK